MDHHDRYALESRNLFEQRSGGQAVPILSILLTGLLLGVSLTGCGDDPVSLTARAAGVGRNSSAPGGSGALPSEDRSFDLRTFEVGDSEFLGFSFDVYVDGSALGTTPSNKQEEWERAVTIGTHAIQVTAYSGAASHRTQVYISLYSEVNDPIQFVEPQNATGCTFEYGGAGDAERTGLGKQYAYCEIRAGGTLSLEFAVGAARW